MQSQNDCEIRAEADEEDIEISDDYTDGDDESDESEEYSEVKPACKCCPIRL
jgi:hypothetical protein